MKHKPIELEVRAKVFLVHIGARGSLGPAPASILERQVAGSLNTSQDGSKSYSKKR